MWSLPQWWMRGAITAVPHLHKESTHVHALFPTKRRLLLLSRVYEKGLWRVKNATPALQWVWACEAGRCFMKGCLESKIICCNILYCLYTMCVLPLLWLMRISTHTDIIFLAYRDHCHCQHLSRLFISVHRDLSLLPSICHSVTSPCVRHFKFITCGILTMLSFLWMP